MLDLPEDVTLFDVTKAKEVTGQLFRLDRDTAKMKIDAVWWSEISSRKLIDYELPASAAEKWLVDKGCLDG